MCQTLFTRRIVQNVAEIIILFVFFSYHNLEIHLSVIRKDPLFMKLDIFLCLLTLELWGLSFTEFRKPSNEHRYRE